MMTTQRFDVATTFGVKARPGLEVQGFADDTHPQIPVRKPYVFRPELLRDVLAFLHDAGGDGLFLTGLRIPRPFGHPFHGHSATDSTLIRPPVPRRSGH